MSHHRRSCVRVVARRSLISNGLSLHMRQWADLDKGLAQETQERGSRHSSRSHRSFPQVISSARIACLTGCVRGRKRLRAPRGPHQGSSAHLSHLWLRRVPHRRDGAARPQRGRARHLSQCRRCVSQLLDHSTPDQISQRHKDILPLNGVKRQCHKRRCHRMINNMRQRPLRLRIPPIL